MTYPDLHTAVLSLSGKLYTFAGHNINPTHNCYCFDKLARAIDHINSELAVRTVNFDAEIYVTGKAVPVIVSVSGTDISSPVDVTVQIA